MKMAISGYWRSVFANQSNMVAPLLSSGAAWNSALSARRPSVAGLAAWAAEAFGFQHLHAARGLVPVDFLHIELAHEGDRLGRDHLAGDHDGEPGRVRNDEIGGDERRAVLQALVHLRTVQLD